MGKGAALELRRLTALLEEDTRTMALALAALFFAGGTIGAISLLLPHPDAFNDGALWSNIALAWGASAALALAAGRLPPWAMQVASRWGRW